MTNELQIFKNEEFGQVRALEINYEPWFVGKDIADRLGYQNGSRDINRHVDGEDKFVYPVDDGTQLRDMLIINESGLYSLILSSKLPSAKKFKRWVTYEVLPAIRKTRTYQKPMCMEDILIAQLQEMKNMKLEVAETKQEVQAIRDVIIINPKAEWRKETNNILTAIGNSIGDYSKPRHEVYEALKVRASCRPSVLINNLKKRALDNGMAPSKADKLNILDVLENDPRLREIYITIVKEMAIKNNVA